MPTYAYACTACGERTEKKQSFDDPPLEECPHCGGKLRKLYSPVGIVFKGSGFYSTDAKSSASKKSSESGKSSSSTPSDSSTDSGAKSSEKKEKGTSSGGDKKSSSNAERSA